MSQAKVLPLGPWEHEELPNFDSVVGLESVKSQLRVSLIEPLKNPTLYDELGLRAGDKFLLYGPPGCGKSFISRAIAGEINASFFELTPSKTFGSCDAIQSVSTVFNNARQKVPSIITIDEMESLTEDREAYSESAYMRAFLNEMLIQIDDTVQNNEKILVMGTTNAPWYIDGAFLRSGRFGQVIFIPPPDFAARRAMLTRQLTTSEFKEQDIIEAAKLAQGMSAADIGGVIRKGRQHILRDMLSAGKVIKNASEVVLDPKILLPMFKEQMSSVTDWFKKFDKHASSMHPSLNGPVQTYLKLLRNPNSNV